METQPLPDCSLGLKQVETVLQDLFAQAKIRASKVSPSYLSLWETLELATAGGKRVRPQIVLASYLHLGGRDLEAAVRLGAAFELLHTALIVHDDVIDLDFSRRGRPNVSGVYLNHALDSGELPGPARHRGLSVGVIAGDLAMAAAFRLLGGVRADPATAEQLAGIFDEAIFASAGGELIDVDFSDHPDAPSVEDILHMERQKTAVYSFEAPLQAGAVLAGADPDTVSVLGEFGRFTGTAYQVVDDLLGVFGSESATGKSNSSDLREGKRTVLISYMVQTRPEWAELSTLIGRPDITPAEADRARELLVSSGARDFARELAEDFAARARDRLACPSVPESLRVALEEVVSGALDRGR